MGVASDMSGAPGGLSLRRRTLRPEGDGFNRMPGQQALNDDGAAADGRSGRRGEDAGPTTGIA